MRVVLDASVVVGALIRPKGWTADELAREDVEWYIPRFLLDELDEHLREFAGMADSSPTDFRRRAQRMRSFHVVEDARLDPHLDDPLVRRAAAVDPDDAPYLAAVLAVGADFLWTRDKAILDAFPSLAVRIVPRTPP